MVQAWSEKDRSRGTAASFVILALLCLYFAVVLLLQASRSRAYQREIATLGFVSLDWNKVPFDDLILRAIFQNRKKSFVSGFVHGDSCGMHFYLFNRARDAAWWSKKRTTVVLQPTGNIDDVLASGIINNADAELARHGDWCMIQARGEIQPKALGQWIVTVGTLLQRR